MILQGRVGDERRADRAGMSGRYGGTEGALEVEIAPALTRGKSGRDQPGVTGEGCGAQGGLNTQKGRDDLVAILFVGAR